MPDRPQTIREAEAWLETNGAFNTAAPLIRVLIQQLAAAESTVRALRESVDALLMSDATPLCSHNERSWCQWCGAKWKKPAWHLDPQPPLFGHPENDCLAVRALLLASPQSQEGKR